MSNIIAFVFEDTFPVRVFLKEGEFRAVLADLCRVLGIKNVRDAADSLEDDEVEVVNINGTMGNTVGNSDGIPEGDGPGRGNPNLNVVTESGLYALIFKSRKPAARRFRKWVTAEVLPALRHTGKYSLPEAGEEPAKVRPAAEFHSLPISERYVRLKEIEECRRLHGPDAARWLWAELGLPVAPGSAIPAAPADDKLRADGEACLKHLLAHDLGGGMNIAEAVARVAKWPRGEEFLHRKLQSIGVRVAAEVLAIANSALELEHVFIATPWAGLKWRNALRALPESRSASSPVRFNGAGSHRAVLVPLPDVMARIQAIA